MIAPLSSAKDPRAKRSHRIICAVRKALAVAAWSRGVRGGDVAAPFCVHHLECSRRSRLLVSVLGMFMSRVSVLIPDFVLAKIMITVGLMMMHGRVMTSRAW